MKTPMNVFNTAMKKKKKNRKGFSLVELIVVLVIMAILAAALVPTLIGYIKQTKQSNAKNEAAAVVSAAQTVVSSAYADGDGVYYNQSASGAAVQILTKGSLDTQVTLSDDATAVVKTLSEAPGTVANIVVKDGVVQSVKYTDKSGTVVNYAASGDNKGYTIGS